MEKVSINGPYNYFKLTNGEKTICLFSDVHNEPVNQTECVNHENSVDIDHFLKEFLIIQQILIVCLIYIIKI